MSHQRPSDHILASATETRQLYLVDDVVAGSGTDTGTREPADHPVDLLLASASLVDPPAHLRARIMAQVAQRRRRERVLRRAQVAIAAVLAGVLMYYGSRWLASWLAASQPQLVAGLVRTMSQLAGLARAVFTAIRVVLHVAPGEPVTFLATWVLLAAVVSALWWRLYAQAQRRQARAWGANGQ